MVYRPHPTVRHSSHSVTTVEESVTQSSLPSMPSVSRVVRSALKSHFKKSPNEQRFYWRLVTMLVLPLLKLIILMKLVAIHSSEYVPSIACRGGLMGLFTWLGLWCALGNGWVSLQCLPFVLSPLPVYRGYRWCRVKWTPSDDSLSCLEQSSR